MNFWATWCAPCVKELPTLDRLAGREAGRLTVLTISQDSDGDDGTAAQKVDRFFAGRRFAGIVAAIASGEAGDLRDVLAAVTPGGGKSVLPLIAAARLIGL